ncbi:DUF336-domain-containing protein, partial [Erysiphe pulchra]
MSSCPLAKITSCSLAKKKKYKEKAASLLTSFTSTAGATTAAVVAAEEAAEEAAAALAALALTAAAAEERKVIIVITPTHSLLPPPPPPVHLTPPPSPPSPPSPTPPPQQQQSPRHQKPLPTRPPPRPPQPQEQQQQKEASPKITRKPVPKKPEQHSQPKSNSKSEEEPILKQTIMSERGSSSVSPRPIRPPPRDLDAISRIDASLVFEHFTTSDAWDLGSTLRERLLPIPTPVVINISLANQNQTIFHSVTHSGVMPDNESWVERKRRTVLRWGCSTWFMACKFGGDEKAFRERYALGNNAGDYAIHGGGVPIRVTGVEGVVAVVVVSGLKEDEDHAVIVE